jgi:threonine dehydrogenase-like Zn-dependent dehydrogenase
VRAVVLGPDGTPALADVHEPEGPGTLVEVVACGLCGSDIEKLGPAHAGAILGHEVVARTPDGRRVALVHHHACGACAQCVAGHESLCEGFAAPTIRPGGFAERVNAQAWVDVPESLDDARATMVEPLACVLRGARHVPAGRVLVVGHGFIGHLFAAYLRHRGDEVFAADPDPRRDGPAPGGAVDAAILCGGGGVETALSAVRPGGTILVFANAGDIPAQRVYRGELTLVGVRSAAPQLMEEAAALLPVLPLPEPVVLPLARFAEGLELFRRRDALKVVFTP